MAVKVSILVPIFCVEKYIERCVISLFSQTYSEIEYIFVDDCTPDNSICVLNKVLEKFPQRREHVRIIRHEKNKGLGAARNTAVAAATGVFVMHVDSDDYLDLTCVSDCVDAQIQTGADIVAIDQIKIRSSYQYRETKPDFFSPTDMCLHIIRRDCPNGVCSNFIRKRLYDENDIRVEKGVSMGEDLIVLPRLLYYAKIVTNQHKSCYYYDNTNEQSYTSSFSETKAQQVWIVLDYLMEFFRDKDKNCIEAINVRRLRVAADHIKSAAISGGHNDYIRGKELLVDELLPSYGSYLSGALRLGLRLRSSLLMRCYFKTASRIKSIIRRIKSK